jgi:hypothetical protein
LKKNKSSIQLKNQNGTPVFEINFGQEKFTISDSMRVEAHTEKVISTNNEIHISKDFLYCFGLKMKEMY